MYLLCPRVNRLKTVPFTAAHSYTAHILAVLPLPPSLGAQAHFFLGEGTSKGKI